jgi:hypothetical protein
MGIINLRLSTPWGSNLKVRRNWPSKKVRRKEIEEKIKKGELTQEYVYVQGLLSDHRNFFGIRHGNLITFNDIYTSELNGLDITSKRLDK